MSTGDILLGGNPAMNKHPVQGGVAILLGMLPANETEISSDRFGLWLMCAFTWYFTMLICKRLMTEAHYRASFSHGLARFSSFQFFCLQFKKSFAGFLAGVYIDSNARRFRVSVLSSLEWRRAITWTPPIFSNYDSNANTYSRKWKLTEFLMVSTRSDA